MTPIATQPFVNPGPTGRLAAIEERLRRLERVSFLGRQRYSDAVANRYITVNAYNLDPPPLEIPVFVPEDAWVSISAWANFSLYNSNSTARTSVWGAVYERTDATDEIYFPGSEQQLFYTYRQGILARDGIEQSPANGFSLISDPRSNIGLAQAVSAYEPLALTYRPVSGGEKIYRLDFKATFGASTPDDWALITSAGLTVEIR